MANTHNITLQNCRLSFPHLFEKDNLADKYSARLLIPKDTPQLEDIKAAIHEAVEFGKTAKWAGKLPKGFTYGSVLKDGDAGDEPQPEEQGCFVLNARSNAQPKCYVRDEFTGALVQCSDPDKFYGGCYVHANVSFFPFASGVNNGVGVALNMLLFFKDGEPFGNKLNADDVFGQCAVAGPVEDDEEVF